MTREEYEVLTLKAVKKAAGSVDHTNLVWFDNQLHVHVFYCPNVLRCEAELKKIPDSEFGLSLFGYTSDNTPRNIWCDSKRNRELIGQDQEAVDLSWATIGEPVPEEPPAGTPPPRARRRNRRGPAGILSPPEYAPALPTPEQMEIARQRLRQINETQGRVPRRESGTPEEPEF